MLNKLQRRNSEGFTIIEVMIVLAIAALILLIVLLAVPALERSSRNTQRRNDVGNILSGISQYVGDNGGALPTTTCTGSACPFWSDLKVGYYQPANVVYNYSATSLATAPAPPSAFTGNPTDEVEIYNGLSCAGTTTSPQPNTVAGAQAGWNAVLPASAVGGSTRALAAIYAVESGGGIIVTCVSS